MCDLPEEELEEWLLWHELARSRAPSRSRTAPLPAPAWSGATETAEPASAAP